MNEQEHLEYLTTKNIPISETELYSENFLFDKFKAEDGITYEYVYTEDEYGNKKILYISEGF